MRKYNSSEHNIAMEVYTGFREKEEKGSDKWNFTSGKWDNCLQHHHSRHIGQSKVDIKFTLIGYGNEWVCSVNVCVCERELCDDNQNRRIFAFHM